LESVFILTVYAFGFRDSYFQCCCLFIYVSLCSAFSDIETPASVKMQWIEICSPFTSLIMSVKHGLQITNKLCLGRRQCISLQNIQWEIQIRAQCLPSDLLSKASLKWNEKHVKWTCKWACLTLYQLANLLGSFSILLHCIVVW
jgi:hypothetical protein